MDHVHNNLRVRFLADWSWTPMCSSALVADPPLGLILCAYWDAFVLTKWVSQKCLAIFLRNQLFRGVILLELVKDTPWKGEVNVVCFFCELINSCILSFIFYSAYPIQGVYLQKTLGTKRDTAWIRCRSITGHTPFILTYSTMGQVWEYQST